MAKATWIQSNFNGGEWSPWCWGRYDLGPYKNAMSLLENFLPTVQGALTRRSGFRWVAGVKDSAVPPRLHAFEFSVAQSYILEVGAGYIRFYVNDGQLLSAGVPYEVSTPYGAADVWGLNFTQKGDTLYITHPNFPVMKLQRAGATNWILSTVSLLDGPYLPVNVTSTTLTPAGTTGTVAVVASAVTGINDGAGFRASDVGRFLRIKCGGVWLWGAIASFVDATNITWTVTAPTGSEVPATAQATANFSAGSVFTVSVTDGGSGYGVTPPSVSFSGGGTPSTAAVAYATLTSGVVTAITVSVTGVGYSSAPAVTLSAPTAIVPGTTTFWRLGLWNATDGYPAVCTFYQDRLTFAGAASAPGRVDGSRSGDYENFAPTKVDGAVVDSNAISFTLNANSANAIVWMTPDENGLLVGTAGGEWIVSPGSTAQALTPSNVSARQMSNFGSCSTQPIRIGKATMFVQRTGRKLRELFYQFTYNTFQASDISLVGEHRTKSGLKQLTVQFAPQQVIWGATNAGEFFGITYDKDQSALGWHGHPLGGFSDAARTQRPLVLSTAAIPAPGSQRDEVWAVVQRYINGAVYCSVEVMAKLWENGDATSDCVFLDSSATYSGAPTTTISGLTWLKGETVGVLTDGAVHQDCVVDGSGAIALSWPASVVQVGFRYTSAGRTMCIEAGGDDGPTQGKIKRIHLAVVRFFQSIGLSMGSSAPGVNACPQPFRTSADPMSGPVGLFDGDKRWRYEGTWGTDGKIYFETSDPLPSNITMLMAQLDAESGQ